MVDGKYVTAPDKMWEFPDGTVIYEGERNRKLVKYIIEIAAVRSVPVFDVTGGSQLDIPLSQKVSISNGLMKDYDVVHCAIHHNAGKGIGTEIFTSPGTTKSDRHATKVMDSLELSISDLIIRADFSDKDVDKEAKFYELTETKCPAWLLEVGFMDNWADAKKILDDRYLHRIALALVDYMEECIDL
jgi:N-acetylmuramoyl-L-alanine amidase